MRQLNKQLLCITTLVSAVSLSGNTATTSKIVPRSQSFNAARQIVGWDNPFWGINANRKTMITAVSILRLNIHAHSETIVLHAHSLAMI